MVKMQIGDEFFEIHAERPADWSMENDYIKSIDALDEHLFKAVSWMGRTMYLVEYFGKTVKLPLQRAKQVSRAIRADLLKDAQRLQLKRSAIKRFQKGVA